jgi:uncharacterized protein (TIGR02145 family)
MKKIFTLFIFLSTFSTLFAQTLYTRKDTIAITQDSVTLQAGQFRGAIQWQRSPDGKTWNDLKGKTSQSVKVAQADEGFYRAKILESTCHPLYSDTAVVVAKKAVNALVTDPGSISGITLVDRDNGIFSYISSGTSTATTSIPVNTVLVDADQESDIRVVTGTTQKGDTLKVTTQPGTMEDLFVNQAFKLSTEMIAPANKSASLNNSALSKALTDKDGFIHPAEVLDLSASGAKLKSVAIDGEIPVANFSSDFSGEHLYNKNGLEILFTEGNFYMGCVFKCEFNFEQQKFLWTKMPTGKLKSCKFYTDKEKTGARAKLILQAKASGEVRVDETFKLRPNVFRKLFKFMVGDVPVWMDVKIDLMAKAVGKLGSTFSVTGGMSSDLGINLGANYEGGSWTPFFDYTKTFSLYGPDYDGHVNYDLRMEVYPRTEILFYSSLGPYLEVVPYLSEKMDYSITGNYNFGLYSGLDARIGSTGAVLGMKIPDFGPVEFNIKKDTIYQEPSKLNIVSGDKQEGIAGKALGKPIVLKALDSDKQPVAELPIHFSTNSGLVDKTSQKTNNNGEASIVWTLGDSEGEQKLEAWLEDGSDQKIKSTVTTLTAKSMIKLPTVETYGASSVSEDSALSGGNITDDGGANITARGVCWNTTGNPSIANSKTENGTGKSPFSSGMSGLIANTTYYVRAYATNIKGTGYGSQVSFTTTSSLLTANVTNITSTTATCGGTISSNNGAIVTARGVCWNTTGNPTIDDNKTNDGTGAGSFTSSLNGLTANTTYYVRAYATNSKGTGYGSPVTFRTSEIQISLPTVSTSAITNITETTATCGGNVTDDGGGTITTRGVCWNTTGNPTTGDSKTTDGSGTGSFTSSLTGLTNNTTYYLRTYTTNSKGTSYGEQVSFTTKCNCEEKFGSFADTRDGHIYKTITIGTQTWMAENLAYLPYTTPMGTIWMDDTPCYYIDDNSHGVFYNWYAAINACPIGWHLPSSAEWKNLSNYLGGDEIAGSKMILNNPPFLTETNNSCFSSNSAYHYSYIFFKIVAGNVYWWINQQTISSYAWVRYIDSNLYFGWYSQALKDDGIAVRCVKN